MPKIKVDCREAYYKAGVNLIVKDFLTFPIQVIKNRSLFNFRFKVLTNKL